MRMPIDWLRMRFWVRLSIVGTAVTLVPSALRLRGGSATQAKTNEVSKSSDHVKTCRLVDVAMMLLCAHLVGDSTVGSYINCSERMRNASGL